jgi:hypothetical protein
LAQSSIDHCIFVQETRSDLQPTISSLSWGRLRWSNDQDIFFKLERRRRGLSPSLLVRTDVGSLGSKAFLQLKMDPEFGVQIALFSIDIRAVSEERASESV